MKYDEIIYRYWLCNIIGFGAIKIKEVIDYFGSAENVYFSNEKDISEMMRIKNNKRSIFSVNDFNHLVQAKEEIHKAEMQYHKLKEHNILFITPEDDTYPERLRKLYDLPQGLYIKGKVPFSDKKAVAVVGARSCSHYGKEMAGVISRELCARGADIISGMAMGIDGEAQRSAIKALREDSDSGDVYAVLGCGPDVCYPNQNNDIYEYITSSYIDKKTNTNIYKGGVISEFPPGTKPLSCHFPMRNRIISGLSDIVVVIEARLRSGSLITADQALEQGKDVYVIPGRTTDMLSRGCNELIKQGAEIITDPIEFVENIVPNKRKIKKNYRKNKNTLALTEEKVYSCLDFSPKHIGNIADETGISVQIAVQILYKLIEKDMVVETVKNYYALKFK